VIPFALTGADSAKIIDSIGYKKTMVVGLCTMGLGALLFIPAASLLVYGFFLFALKMVGGGDVKLLAATSLWAGPALILSFTFITAIAGGVIGLAMLLLQRRRAVPVSVDSEHGAAPAVMPYGVAIAVGGLMVALTLLKGMNL